MSKRSRAMGWIGCLIWASVVCLGAGLPWVSARADDDANGIRPSIVKIHATIRPPELFRPWTKAAPQQGTGSGVVIDGKRIMTNAHVVSYASQVYVQPYQSADRLPARVEAVSDTMDLAILKLEDESFFDDRRALPFREPLPRIKQQVNVYGYPTGGEDLSVTEGIISRIEMGAYHLGVRGLVIQVDAALNPGNSGGAAMIDGQIAGIARANIPAAENIGYLIPVEEVMTFLEDIADGAYDGKYNLDNLSLQTTENPALRDRLGLDAGTTGLMVTRREDERSPLEEWDVITHIAGHDIQNDGQVRLDDNLRVSFYYYVDKLAADGELPMTVFRDGQSFDVPVPIRKRPNVLVPPLAGEYPRYYIYGPLTFTQVTRDLVSAVPPAYRNLLTLTKSPLMTQAFDNKDEEGQELVAVSSPMFPHRITKGYDSPVLAVVKEINGQPIKNLRGLVEVLESADEEFIEIKFVDKGREHMVFRRTEALEAMEDILTDNGIRYRASKDLRDLLKDED